MVFESNFPRRHENHVLETMSYKVFNNSIPDHWIVREMTERDYGFDAMLEIAANPNKLCAKLAAVQLKASKKIIFASSGFHSHYGVDKRTTNYWLHSNIPTFLFFTDEETRVLYYISVQKYARENFDQYESGNGFSYRISNENIFSEERFLDDFYQCENLNELELCISHAQTFHNVFSRFFDENHGRDFHMGVDDEERVSMLSRIYSKIKSFCDITHIPWGLESIDVFASQKRVGSAYDLYEYHFTEILKLLDEKLLAYFIKIKEIVLNRQSYYWQKKDASTFNFLKSFDGKTRYQIYRAWVDSSRGRV
jgi:hypothetical protein